MKDWELKKQSGSSLSFDRDWGRYYLIHHHRYHGFAAVRWNPDGHWYCVRCKERAPEEMQFVAELAGCHR